jgi:hypothetical protein
MLTKREAGVANRLADGTNGKSLKLHLSGQQRRKPTAGQVEMAPGLIALGGFARTLCTDIAPSVGRCCNGDNHARVMVMAIHRVTIGVKMVLRMKN